MSNQKRGLTFSPETNIDAKKMWELIQGNHNLPKEIKNAFKVSDDGKRLDIPKNVKVPKEWIDVFGALRAAIHNGNWEMTTGQTNMPTEKLGAQFIPDINKNDQPGIRWPEKATIADGVDIKPEWNPYANMPLDKGNPVGETFAPEGRQPANSAEWLGNKMRADAPDQARDNGNRGLIGVADRIKDVDGKDVDLTKSEEGSNLIVSTLLHEASEHAGPFEQGQLSGHTYQNKFENGVLKPGQQLTPEETKLKNRDDFLKEKFQESKPINQLPNIIRKIRDNEEKLDKPQEKKDAKDSEKNKAREEDRAFDRQKKEPTDKKDNGEKKEGPSPKKPGLTFSPESHIDAETMLKFIQANQNLPKEIRDAFQVINDGNIKRLDIPNDVKGLPGEWQEVFDSLQAALNSGNWEMTTAETSLVHTRADGTKTPSEFSPDTNAKDTFGKREHNTQKDVNGEYKDKGLWGTYKIPGTTEGDVHGETFKSERLEKTPDRTILKMRSDLGAGIRDNGTRGLLSVADRVKDLDGKVVDIKRAPEGKNDIVHTFVHEAAVHAGQSELGKLWNHSGYEKKLDKNGNLKPGEELTDAEKYLKKMDDFLGQKFEQSKPENQLSHIIKSIRKNDGLIDKLQEKKEAKDSEKIKSREEDKAFDRQKKEPTNKKDNREKQDVPSPRGSQNEGSENRKGNGKNEDAAFAAQQRNPETGGNQAKDAERFA